jgi:hypothetical protein
MARDDLPYYEYQRPEIKYCKDCGHVQRLPYKYFVCPACDMPGMLFFTSLTHIVGYIDMYGLKNMNIIDDDIREAIIQAFQ